MKVIKIRLIRAWIYGFGKWVDVEIRFLQNTVHIFYGENEAGKSTLQNFLLFMLFGLPPKQRRMYRPKTSSKMGGRLTIFKEDIGEITIERIDNEQNGSAICYLQDGKVEGEEWLQLQFKGFTKTMYESIFAFSALDLNKIRNLKGRDFGETLLDIGITGATNIQTIEKSLDNKLGELFKKAGKVPKINVQLKELDTLLTKRQQIQKEERTYRDKTVQANQLNENIRQHKLKLSRLNDQLNHVEKTIESLSSIHQYLNIKEKLTLYPANIRFPEQGVERFQLLKEPLFTLKSEYAVLQEYERQYLEKQTKLESKLMDKEVYEEAVTIRKKLEIFDQSNRVIDDLTKRIQKLNIHLNAETSKLPETIQLQEMKGISLPYYIEKQWNELKHQVEALQTEEEQLQYTHQQLRNKEDELKQQRDLLTDRLLADDKIKEMEEQVFVSDESDRVRKLLQNLGNSKEKKHTKAILYATFFIIVLLNISHFLLFEIPFFLFVILILVMISVGSLIVQKLSMKQTDKLFEILQNNFNENELTESKKEKMKKMIEEQYKLRHTFDSIQKDLRSLESEKIKWKERQFSFSQQKDRHQLLIEKQYEAYPFLRSIPVSHWPEFYYVLKRIIELQNEKKSLLNKYKQLEDEKVELKSETVHLLTKLKQQVDNQSFINLKETIKKLVNQHDEYLQKSEQYRSLINENKEKQKNVKKKIESYKKEMKILFSEAYVENEEEFFRVANLTKQKQELEAAYEKLKEQLSIRFNEFEMKEWENQKINLTHLEKEKKVLEEKIEAIEQNLEEDRQKLADVTAQIKQLEGSTSLSENTYLMEMGKEKLKQLVKEWAVYKAAKELLLETKRSYREKMFPKIFTKTSTYFSKITEGAYHRVIAPDENELLQVETPSKILYDVNDLSQGTIDQLYISLRLAMSEVIIENQNIPFLMDDAFIHFDEIRTKRIMEIMKEISKKQQVILFTCKRDILEFVNDQQITYLEKSVHLVKN